MQASAASTSRRNPPLPQSSPADAEESNPTSNGVMNGPQHVPSTGWREPPLKAPAPSFTEYKGLERHGVLERMMPLGTNPTAKVNARKKGEPLRRTVQARNLEGMELDDSRATPDVHERAEGTPVAESTRASSARVEEQAGVSTPPIEEVTDHGVTPELTEDQGHNASTASAPPISTPISTPRQFSLPPVPTLVPGSPFDRALRLATHRSHMATAHQVPWVNAFAHNDPEFDQILTALSTIPEPAARPPELLEAYERKVKKMKKKLKKAQRAHGSTQLPFVAQNSLAPSPQASQNRIVLTSPKRKPNATTSPAVNNETPDNKIATSLNPTSNRSSPLKMTLNLNKSPASRRDKPNNVNGLPPAQAGSPLKTTETRSGMHSRRSTSSELSPVDEDVVEAPPSFLDPNKGSLAGTKRSAADASLLNQDDHAQEAKRIHLRQNFDHVTAKESFTRPHRDRPLRSPKPRQTMAEQSRQLRLRVLNESANAINGLESPTMNGSRGPTPPTSLGRPPKNAPANPKKTAKLKLSPQKDKKSAVIAGVARSDNNRRAGSVGDDDNSEQSNNNDYCSACGGSGFMLCCDGCPRSYHFTCVDPPLDSESSLDDPWYCYNCMALKEPPKKQEPGLFAALLQQVEKKNPESFKLPDYVRDFFDGVRTGEDGEYVEATTQKPNTRARTGYDEAPDWQRLKDSKGNTILCYHCGKSSLDHRDIIPCDYCNLYWHLDCLNPPLANPPNRGFNARTRPAWMCPNHVDHDLRHLEPVIRDGVEHDNVTKAHRVRRPRNPRIVDVAMRRGFKNRGLIEIADDSSDDSGFESEEKPDGHVYSLKPKGIMLDFIDKVKRNREDDYTRTLQRTAEKDEIVAQLRYENERTIAQRLQSRPANDRWAALNLTQLSINNRDLNLSSNNLDNLVYSAEAEAPLSASSVANGHRSREERRAELLRQRDLIDRELDALQ